MRSYRLIKAATLGPELIKAITTTLLGVKPYFHIAQFNMEINDHANWGSKTLIPHRRF